MEFQNTERILELQAEYGMQACFAVVGAAALPGHRPYHDPDQIRRIDRLGHEIASHSMYHDWLPGLGYDQLLQTLRESKDALEQCTGSRVVTFVPPFNQPYDYFKKWSFSLSERRTAGQDRIDLSRLCKALGEAGYLFSRVSYSSLYERLLARVFRRDSDRPEEPQQIGGVTCIRVNTPGGFMQPTLQMVERSAREGKFVIAWGHPHSLKSGNTQDERYLVLFLEQVRQLVAAGELAVVTPNQLVSAVAGR